MRYIGSSLYGNTPWALPYSGFIKLDHTFPGRILCNLALRVCIADHMQEPS